MGSAGRFAGEVPTFDLFTRLLANVDITFFYGRVPNVRHYVSPLAAALLICACSADAEDRPQTSSSSDPAPGDIASPDPESLDTSAPDASPQDTATVDTTGDDATTDSDAADANSDETVHFRITSPRSDQPVEYRLQVATEPTKVRDGSRFEAEEDNDTISEREEVWEITGQTGTAASSDQVYGDSFRWPRPDQPEYGIAGWSTDAPAEDYTLTIDGDEVDPATLPAIETDTPADCLGGGGCYRRRIRAADADIVVESPATLEDLQSTLEDASSGDVVFVASAVEIDLGYFPDSPSIEVPAGVTLAGDRGVDGSEGALLHGDKKPGSDWQGSDTIRVRDDARITGLRLEGPTPDRDMNWLGDDHDYTDGIDVGDASGVEIDNNELSGWPYAAVSGGNPVHVHHNVIHDNDQRGLGYGVSGSHWDSTIEYNRFERNRHAVAGSGAAGEGYIVRHNVFGAEGIGGAGHKIDMHEDPDSAGDAGTRLEVYNNTVEFADAQAVYLRATPRESAEIYDNWFHNETQPCLTKNAGSYCAIQVKADDFTNVDHRGNHYGRSEPDCSIGAPRDGC